MELPTPKEIDAFIPSKADMSHCPLCLNKFTLYEEPGKDGKVYLICVKPKCMISIWIRDPMLGRWTRIKSEQCPVCAEKNMRLFFRSDGYIKMLCAKCGCCVENVDNDKHAALMKKEEAEGKRKALKGLQPPPTEKI